MGLFLLMKIILSHHAHVSGSELPVDYTVNGFPKLETRECPPSEYLRHFSFCARPPSLGCWQRPLALMLPPVSRALLRAPLARSRLTAPWHRWQGWHHQSAATRQGHCSDLTRDWLLRFSVLLLSDLIAGRGWSPIKQRKGPREGN